MTQDLFSSRPIQDLPGTPLPERVRPRDLDQILGQENVLKVLNTFIQQKRLPSLIFWGPPGTGKTTTAQALATHFHFRFVSVNAIETGAKSLKEIGDEARRLRIELDQQTLLFVDEIHRFNKAQQDVLLPFVEKGELILIGATTENPSYEINKALLSRCRILAFQPLNETELLALFQRTCQRLSIQASEEVLSWSLKRSSGDARKLLQILEELEFNTEARTEAKILEQALGDKSYAHDKNSDAHYDTISAFIKSIRGSDADAALYYLARMILGGEDPLFIARRLIILASEDVGNADPRALSMAVSGAQAFEMIGLPEGAICLAQVVTYLASAPKSNRSYEAWNSAKSYVQSQAQAPVPLSLRSARTEEMKKQGYGEGYKYPHQAPKSFISQNYWPAGVQPQAFYQPKEIGFEKQIRDYAAWLKSEVVR